MRCVRVTTSTASLRPSTSQGRFADYGVRHRQQLVAFIEVKRCTTKLSPKHLRQVTLVRGQRGRRVDVARPTAPCWHVFHLTGGLPIASRPGPRDRPPGRRTGAARGSIALFDLTRERFAAAKWTSPGKPSQHLSGVAGVDTASEPCLDAIRKELRRQTGHNVEPTESACHLRTGVLRPEFAALGAGRPQHRVQPVQQRPQPSRRRPESLAAPRPPPSRWRTRRGSRRHRGVVTQTPGVRRQSDSTPACAAGVGSLERSLTLLSGHRGSLRARCHPAGYATGRASRPCVSCRGVLRVRGRPGHIGWRGWVYQS